MDQAVSIEMAPTEVPAMTAASTLNASLSRPCAASPGLTNCATTFCSAAPAQSRARSGDIEGVLPTCVRRFLGFTM
jgi:hypothetical protein